MTKERIQWRKAGLEGLLLSRREHDNAVKIMDYLSLFDNNLLNIYQNCPSEVQSFPY
jgi:hypothetical protein